MSKKKGRKKYQLDLGHDYIDVIGAREHNLKDINVRLPRNKMTVITGISGSGKSSLAFDTIFAEGQRRYIETFSSYARQFLGNLERPDVEKINGLSPVISIEQKTTGWNPRSTVGTITEVYDFMRLLFARAGDAYSYVTGKKMVKYTEDQIIEHISSDFDKKRITILAPLVRARKGHYRELFDHIRKQGYSKARVDGEIVELLPKMQVDRYKTHDIEVVIDRIKLDSEKSARLASSLKTAMRMGNGSIFILNHETESVEPYSKHLMCPVSGISYDEPSPNTFSFNSPYGACQNCKGLGKVNQVDMDKLIPDDTRSINDQGIAAFGEVRDTLTFKQLRQIAKAYQFTFATPVKQIPSEALEIILYGGKEGLTKIPAYLSHDFAYNLARRGYHEYVEKVV